MKYAAAVIDTNIVVAALLTGVSDSPTARILDGMCKGAFPFLLSTALLGEYREVLLRKKIRVLHGLSESQVDILLTVLAANAIVREPEPRTGAPDAKDDHLWSLVQSESNCVLVTGDQALAKSPPPKSVVLQPRGFVDSLPA
ncbi:MAG: putative toxin-antitoxin system toxin component, PIN family [Pseudomonadota bacterium]|nr:putative toxin-antitoxin system toxin component, PIN family [Pseudomonadota bacterium]